jgi:hypothetical protein
VNRALAEAVNFNYNIDYKVKKPPARYPIGGPRGVSVMKVEGDYKYIVNRARAAAVNTTSTTRLKIFKYNVSRAWAAAVNFKFNIDYEVKNPPVRHPIGGPRGVSVMKGEGDICILQCEPHMGGGCDLQTRLRGQKPPAPYPIGGPRVVNGIKCSVNRDWAAAAMEYGMEYSIYI